jgi:hypothetical protein
MILLRKALFTFCDESSADVETKKYKRKQHRMVDSEADLISGPAQQAPRMLGTGNCSRAEGQRFQSTIWSFDDVEHLCQRRVFLIGNPFSNEKSRLETIASTESQP